MLRVGRGMVAICRRGAKQRHWNPCMCRSPVFVSGCAPSFVATITTPAFSRQLEDKSQNPSPTNAVTQQSEVFKLIEAATANGSVTGALQGVQRLSEWVTLRKIDYKKDLECDADFIKLLKTIEKGIAQLSPSALLEGLKSLLNLGMDSNTYLIQSLENEVLWNIRKVSMPLLLSIVVFQVKHQHTDLQRKVLRESVETVQRRWVEIRGVKDIQVIYNHHEVFNLEFISRIDDRTIELAEEMSYTDLSRLFCTFATAKRRVTPVLRSLAFHMARQSDRLPPKQLSNVLYAMNSLSFPDPLLLEKIANDFVSQANSIDRPAIVGGILTCMGQMRWRNTSMLEILSEWVENNSDVCRTSDIAALVLTLASVSYTPTNIDSVFKAIIPKLTSVTINKETAWLDVVWSLSVLGKATEEHIASVLNPSFVSKIPSAAQHQRTGIKLKLLNINAVARLNMPTYKGPFLDLSDFKDVIITQGRHELMLAKNVQTMLHNFLPPPKYIRENIQTNMGIFVDVELAVAKDGKPIPIEDFTTNFGEKVSSKPLPEGAQKLAMFIWDYRDYTIGSQELTGINRLAMELVRKHDYNIVQVPYYEYNMKAKTIKNVQYLEGKTKEAVSTS
ncbi:FAST kinase domain-containing protein 4-like isoform X2 [Penaeus chinensis]|uniref:FAST kinase domain-containing protein 4-like isoform X2 n=1 Tax=Penaeus chinensis TaxID=139456 RepID=UPI001FB719A3|nr:FAST kinase domain-containing protein 4-like isoform X2 [Penaeus chinensis]